MSALSLACSLLDNTENKNQLNNQLLSIILAKNPNINYKDMFMRTPLHHAA